jgi:enoyl-CoA hydratase/carnithine racemase
MSERVQLSIDNQVATVRMARPEKRNALDAEMFEAIIHAGKRITEDKSIRAVVLHGEGKAFCAGLDFGSFMGSPDMMQKLLSRTEESPANMAQRAGWIWQEVQVPVIAAIHGFAFGGGLQIALGADLRYVTADSPDMSITQTMLGLVPVDVAKELMFTGRIISGTEALGIGLATKVSEDPLADALETARLIATKSPHAIRAGKALLRDALKMTRADALKLETALQVSLLGSPNQMEAVQANMTKRDPSFKDPE